ncbi:BppU family phage baseplate upper protein, partial [Cetobacterium sp.]|uniref:BppU family phage baseplate upper protein n=1 Tax=Cetobacterium sp. TaxID=2071632 RepID=UPI003EE5A553
IRKEINNMYIREIKSKSSVDFKSCDIINTEVVFKQYDVNSSCLLVDLTFDNQPYKPNLTDTLYMVSKNLDRDVVDVKILSNAEIKNGKAIISISNIILNTAGRVENELLIVNEQEKIRLTSQKFIFNVDRSILSNKIPVKPEYVELKDLNEILIVDKNDVDLLVKMENLTSFKLSFTASEVDNLLTSVKNLNNTHYNKSEIDTFLSQITTKTPVSIVTNEGFTLAANDSYIQAGKLVLCFSVRKSDNSSFSSWTDYEIVEIVGVTYGHNVSFTASGLGVNTGWVVPCSAMLHAKGWDDGHNHQGDHIHIGCSAECTQIQINGIIDYDKPKSELLKYFKALKE